MTFVLETYQIVLKFNSIAPSIINTVTNALAYYLHGNKNVLSNCPHD
jgi:hypothetical protein